ncbi:MAG: hypothetical protein ACE37J_13895 [Pikeienuella sp.]|uniref:hypothetical protein n=1 Tax=Pikeienuella sp. TaxID=2831957 RepID=UPI00391D831F
MAKTKILDAILAAPRGRYPHIDAARDLLVMPEENHVFLDGDPFRAAVDRYLVPDEAFPAVKETMLDFFRPEEGDRYVLYGTCFQVPLARFWVEMFGYGYLFDGTSGVLHGFLKTPQGIVPSSLSQVTLTERGAVLSESFNVGPLNDGEVREFMALAIARFIAFCALVTTPRAVSVRRQSPGRMTRAERMAIQRAAQRGRPMHSFNVVTFRPGGPSIQRGCVTAAESISGGVRRHWASGHWRLICPKDGRAAYVTWIDATEKGNAAIGRVVKTKVVKVAAGEVRRGYVLPARAGKRGERIEVQAAH